MDNVSESTSGSTVPNVKNSFQIKQGPYQPPCPNCGYCPHCGRSNNYTHWYVTPTTTTTASPNMNGTSWTK